MDNNEIKDWLEERCPDEGLLTADGFDAAIIGVDNSTFNQELPRVIYSVSKCLDILTGQGMSYEEAREFFDFNVSGGYHGAQTPIWCEDTDIPQSGQ